MVTQGVVPRWGCGRSWAGPDSAACRNDRDRADAGWTEREADGDRRLHRAAARAEGSRCTPSLVSHPRRTTVNMPRIVQPARRIAPVRGAPPSSSIARRPGRPRLYCRDSLPPACLRAPSRLRASAHRATAAGAGHRRRLVGQRLRARWVDRSIRQDSRTAHQRQTGRSPARNAVWAARASRGWAVLHGAAPAGLSDLHDGRRIQSAPIRHQRLERALPAAIAARRHR